MVFLIFIGANVWGQSKQVKGVVKDVTGETVIGVSIVEKNTTNGTVTDFNGNFTLNVSSDNPVLQVSYIGFKSQEVSTKGKTSLTIIMEEDAALLGEVVVVGYGAQKKRV